MKFKVYDTKYIQIGSDAFKLEPNTEYKLDQFPEHLRKAIEYIITKNPTQFKIIPIESEKITIIPKIIKGMPTQDDEPEVDIEIEDESEIVEEVKIPAELEPEIVEKTIDFDSMTKYQIIDFILDSTDEYTRSQLNKLKVQDVKAVAKSL